MILRPDYINAIEPFIDSPIVKILAGVRRCGKSTILEMVADELMQRGVSKESIIERRYKGTPVHIAQTRDFRAHIVQRIRKHTALRQFFRIQFNIFEVHMENLIFKLI